MTLLSDKRVVGYSPVVTMCLLEWANLSQIWRMWGERSAAGQSLMAWLSVNAALWIWFNYYRVFVPERLPRVSCGVGIFLNSLVIGSVVYFRYLVGR